MGTKRPGLRLGTCALPSGHVQLARAGRCGRLGVEARAFSSWAGPPAPVCPSAPQI